MFDFAFSEVLVICVVALVVLGPTRLPGVVRKLGRWIGKARAMARDFRQQLENEVTLEELNRMTEKQSRRDPAGSGAAASSAASATGPDAAGVNAASGADAAGVDATTSTHSSSASPGPASQGASADALADAPAPPQPGDDTYSHAHAEGDAPQPWHPEPELEHDRAAHADPAHPDEQPALEPANANAGKAHS